MPTFELSVAAGDADRDELADYTAQLRRELLDGDVERVEFVSSGEAPAGSRAGAAIEVGLLAVTVLQSPEVLRGMIQAVTGWIGHRNQCTVRVKLGDDELELDGATSDERQAVVDAWLSRHGGG